jgi:predicted metal-dependent hydrolase
VVPWGTRLQEIEFFVGENREWIKRAQESFARQYRCEPFTLPQEIELKELGQVISVCYKPKINAKSVYFRVKGRQVTLSGHISNEKLCVNALKRWLTSVARKEFELKLRALSELTGITYNKLQIRAQRTRWGSRSDSGTISLNLCLLFLEPRLLRYLMIHELCHKRHMNHSKSFWRFVSIFEPNYQKLDRELTECWNRVPGWLGIY